MKLPIFSLLLLTLFVCPFSLHAQKRAVSAIVIDERLSLLRLQPSLFANSSQRIRRGRRMQIIGVAERDGVRFFKVAARPRFGWMQSEALVSRSRTEDEQRLVRLVNASVGFEQIELATIFFEMYPSSKFRSPVLLLYGDLLEEIAIKLSRDATSRLSRREMLASGAPIYSYYLNFSSLDRYRKLGVTFLFNPETRTFHYDGASWNEIVRKLPSTPEAAEARKRLESLKEKMERAAN